MRAAAEAGNGQMSEAQWGEAERYYFQRAEALAGLEVSRRILAQRVEDLRRTESRLSALLGEIQEGRNAVLEATSLVEQSARLVATVSK